MRQLFNAALLAAMLILSIEPCKAQGTIPSWGQIASPAERRALEAEISEEAARSSASIQTLDRVARFVGGRYPRMSANELLSRIAGLAQKLKETETALANLRTSLQNAPPAVRDKIAEASLAIEEGRLDDAYAALVSADRLAASTASVSARDYVDVLLLSAKVLELQQSPAAASARLRSAIVAREGEFRVGQLALHQAALDIEVRWAEARQTPEAGARALESLASVIALSRPGADGRDIVPQDYVDLRLPDNLERGATINQCVVANLFLVRSDGRDRADLLSGIAQYAGLNLSPDASDGKAWECQSVLARIEILLGLIDSNTELANQGMRRLTGVLSYYGYKNACPINFSTYGTAIYRFAMHLKRNHGLPASQVQNIWPQLVNSLRFAHKSLLVSPPPEDLIDFVSENEIVS